jgi:capsular polysaccharide biosynthesis protein
MTGEEIDLVYYLRILWKRKISVFLITAVVLVLTLNMSLLWPETYESESVIQLGMIGEEQIYSSVEAKSILASSAVLNPVIEDFFPDKNLRDFNKDNMEVKIITERIAFTNLEITPLLEIKTKAGNPVKAKEINEGIIRSFFSYVNSDYEERIIFLNQGISEARENIDRLEREFSGSEESDLILLKLVEERKREFQLKSELNSAREFKIVSYPFVPDKASSPRIFFNMLIAFISGLAVSVIFIIFQNSFNEN